MNHEAVIEHLCLIPVDFHEGRHASAADLIARSGYLEAPDVLTVENLEGYLEQRPHLINKWIQWSEDQRCHPAWVFGRGSGGYYLYRVPDNGEDYVIRDGNEACAEFIIRVVRELAPFAKR